MGVPPAGKSARTPPAVLVFTLPEPVGATLVFCFSFPLEPTYSSTFFTVIAKAALVLSLAGLLSIARPRDFVVSIAFLWAGDPMPDFSLA